MPREKIVNKDSYADAVLRTKSTDDAVIADFLGVNRSSVYRFVHKSENKQNVENAVKALEEIKNVRYDEKYLSFEAFYKLPCIVEWGDKQLKNEVSQGLIKERARALFAVCKKLKSHPENLSVRQCADLVLEMRELTHDEEKKPPRGLSYYTIRKPIRSWFMIMKKISGDSLTIEGIDAKASKGTGSMASEKIPWEIREKIYWEQGDNTLSHIRTIVIKYNEQKNRMWNEEDIENITWEIMGLMWFMYYTATRIDSTTDAYFNDADSVYLKNIFRIHVIDKGKRGGIHWKKRLVGDGLNKFLTYVEHRHNIKKEEAYYKLPTYKSLIFPWAYDNYDDECAIMRECLESAGYIPHQPNHIFRHTFAQDGLPASDYNYELIADLGGWKSVDTMKRSYGKISEESKDRGLMRIMGLPVEDVTYQLRWVPLKCIYDKNKICFDPTHNNTKTCSVCQGIKEQNPNIKKGENK